MPNVLTSLRGAYARQSRAGRELLIAVAAVFFGLIVMPLLIWAAGRLTLGPYGHGGPFALMVDFFAGLFQGSYGFWIAALGPYLLLCVLRIALAGSRR